jgi:hypothetical protein
LAPFFYGKFGSIPLKDHHFGSIPLLSHLHVGPHESITCGVHGIYLKFGSFNGIDPIVPFFIGRSVGATLYCTLLSPTAEIEAKFGEVVFVKLSGSGSPSNQGVISVFYSILSYSHTLGLVPAMFKPNSVIFYSIRRWDNKCNTPQPHHSRSVAVESTPSLHSFVRWLQPFKTT